MGPCRRLCSCNVENVAKKPDDYVNNRKTICKEFYLFGYQKTRYENFMGGKNLNEKCIGIKIIKIDKKYFRPIK